MSLERRNKCYFRLGLVGCGSGYLDVKSVINVGERETIMLHEWMMYVIDKVAVLFLFLFIIHGVFGLPLVKEKRNYFVVILMVMLGALLVYSGDTYFSIDTIYGETLLMFLCPFFLLRERNCLKIASLFPAYFVMSFFADCIAVVMSLLTRIELQSIVERTDVGIQLERDVIACIFFAVLGRVFCKNDKKLYQLLDKKSYFVMLLSLFCISTFAGFVIISLFADVLYTMQMVRLLALFSVLTGFLSLFVVMYLIYLIQKQYQQEQIIKLLDENAKVQEKYYEILYHKNKEVSSFRHDYRHHLKCLLGWLVQKDYQQAEKYIMQLNDIGESALNRPYIYSGNMVVDAIIYGALCNCTKEEIQFSYKGKIQHELKIDGMDLCILLSNALENAVEACKKCDKKRIINMSISIYEETVHIEIKNTWNMRSGGDLLITTKKDKENHGYGIENMKRVVKKYNGELQFDVVNDEFITYIQLN